VNLLKLEQGTFTYEEMVVSSVVRFRWSVRDVITM